MTGVIINAVSVVVAGTLGKLLFQKLFSKYSDSLYKAMGILIIFIGISGGLKSERPVILMLSLIAGCLIGEVCDIDGRLNRLGERIGKLRIFEGSNAGKGMISATIIFCSGAMAISGPIQSGLLGVNDTLIIKSVLDGCTVIILSATYGLGVVLAAVPMFVYEGFFAVSAGLLSQVMSDAAIIEVGATGSILIIAIGINFLGTKLQIKAANLIPAIFLPWPFMALHQALSPLLHL